MTGSFGYGTHNPYTSTAFIAKVDQNGKINNIRIFYYPYYLYNTKWTVYSSPYFVWQFVGSGYIVSTRFDYNYQSEASCYNTLLSGTYDLHSFHYNIYSGWLVSSFIYSNYVYWMKTAFMWGTSYYFLCILRRRSSLPFIQLTSILLLWLWNSCMILVR